MTWTFADVDDYWRFLIELTALGPLVRSLSDDARARFRATLDERLRPFARTIASSFPPNVGEASRSRDYIIRDWRTICLVIHRFWFLSASRVA